MTPYRAQIFPPGSLPVLIVVGVGLVLALALWVRWRDGG